MGVEIAHVGFASSNVCLNTNPDQIGSIASWTIWTERMQAYRSDRPEGPMIMSNFFQEAKWQFGIDPVGSLFRASFFALFLVMAAALILAGCILPQVQAQTVDSLHCAVQP